MTTAPKLRRHLVLVMIHEGQNFTIETPLIGKPNMARKRTVQDLTKEAAAVYSSGSVQALLNSVSAQPHNHALPQTHSEQILHLEQKSFIPRVVQTFKTLKLCTPSDISPETQALWIKYNGRVPTTIDARECWGKKRPTDKELFLATYEYLQDPKEVLVIRRGETINDLLAARDAFGQLANPYCWQPIKLIGFQLDILPDGILTFPFPSDIVQRYHPSNLQLMLTPKYSRTTLHLDAADGLSGIVSQTGRKIFATFPNSPYNNSLFKSTGSNEGKLETVGDRLEGGITITITAKDVIDLPANCLHAVWATKGCFLASLDYTTPESVEVYADLLGNR
ncbi:hypothetical protein VF21_03041 [Pseudogymnoascus sp. 05NY08]|nr:hypothetical protein VF21_03041 [Pseudogymnoascus sp. 05NY08]